MPVENNLILADVIALALKQEKGKKHCYNLVAGTHANGIIVEKALGEVAGYFDIEIKEDGKLLILTLLRELPAISQPEAQHQTAPNVVDEI